ncbi:MAG TPA: hypothetical protein VGL54_01680 [Solirubrobacteraceae bacterium]|jgi:hypothetical protein
MGENTEEVDALPVLAQEPTVIASPAGALPAQATGRVVPAVQAAAVAAGGFVAGAAVVGLVHRRRRATLAKGAGARRLIRPRPPRRDGRSKRKTGELLQIVGSRSLLVDVHLLGGER